MINGMGSVERWMDKLSIPVDTAGKAMHLAGHKNSHTVPQTIPQAEIVIV